MWRSSRSPKSSSQWEKSWFSPEALCRASLSTSPFMQDARSSSSTNAPSGLLQWPGGEQPGCCLVLCLLDLATVVMDLPLRTRHDAVAVEPERNDIGGCQTQHVRRKLCIDRFPS
jgi:hypothetical protein